MKRFSPLCLFLLCFVPIAFPAAAGESLREVSVIFHWKAQAQWAGYYMAKEKGIYAKHGLNVTLLSRRGRSDSLDQLMDDRVTFATHFLSAGVGLREPVVLVGQVFNRSNLMVVARRSDGVEAITDLSGKAVCFWDGYYRVQFVFPGPGRRQSARASHGPDGVAIHFQAGLRLLGHGV